MKTLFNKTRTSMQRKITLVFVAVLAGFGLLATVIIVNNRNARKTETLVNKTYQVSHLAESIRSNIAESEVALNRYLLSRDTHWLAALHNTQQRLAASCRQNLTLALDSTQQQRLDTVRQLIARKTESQLAILKNPGLATQLAGSSLGSRDSELSLAIQTSIERFMNRQEQLLEVRNLASEKARFHYAGSIITAAFLLFLFIAGALLKINRGIIRRKLAQDELKIKELKYRRLVDDVGVTLFTSDTSGLFTFVNEKCQQLTGFSQEELLGKSFSHLLLPSWVGQISAVYLQQVRDRTPELSIEFPIVTREGDIKWVEQHSVILYDEQDRPSGYQCVVKDISGRREQEEKLKQSEARFRLTLESLGDNVWEYDLINNKVFFTQTRQNILGADISSLDKLWLDCIHPEDQWMLKEVDEQYRAGIIDRHSIEYRIHCEDGPEKWILDRGVAIEKAHDRSPIRVIGTHTDITTLKLAEEKLRESDLKIRAMLKSSRDGFYMLDKEKRIIQVNDSACRFLELLTGRCCYPGDDITNFVNESRKELFEQIFQSVKNGNSEEAEVKLDGPEGETWFDVEYFPVLNDDKKVVAVCISTRDITERKLTEKALEKIRAEREEYQFRLQSIVDNTPLVIFVKDLDGKYLLINRAFRKTFNLTDAEVIGTYHLSFSDPEQEARFLAADQQAILTLQSVEMEEIVETTQGKRHLRIVRFPLFDKDKKIYAIGGIASDYSHEVEYRQRLIEGRENAEATDHLLLQESLVKASHDARIPLNDIISMTGTLLESPLDSEQRNMIRIIRESSESLLSIMKHSDKMPGATIRHLLKDKKVGFTRLYGNK